jgi:hypothetical protein
MGLLGLPHRPPVFTEAAPPLYGFDEDIDGFCANRMRQVGMEASNAFGHAGNCIAANVNILSLFGTRVQYNQCRNLEWQVCSANLKLPGQAGANITFARAPSSLDPMGSTGKPLGKCRGWVPGKIRKGSKGFGYATDDVFYLEVCLFNQICTNGAELFELKAGEPFRCNFSSTRFDELREILLQPALNYSEGLCH